MKKYLTIGLIIILLIGLIYTTSAQQTTKNINTKEKFKEEMLLLDSIKTAGFIPEQFNTNTSISIPNTFLTIEQLEEKQKEIMQILNISGEITIINMDNMYDPRYQNYFEDLLEIEGETILQQRIEDDGHNEIITFIPNEEGNMTAVKLLSTKIVGNTETHIIVDIVQNKGYKEIVGTSNQITKLLKKYGDKVETTINITGVQLGKLNDVEEKDVQKTILNFLKAKRVETLEDKFFTSITAYSPLISSYISYSEKNVNVQLAIRYSEYEDKTYIWIGTPLITTTY